MATTQFLMFEDTDIDSSLFDPDHRLFVTVRLDGAEYGLPIQAVQEVKNLSEIKVRPLLKAPPFILGVFNVRGSIVPLVDLRVKWALQTKEPTAKTSVVVLQLHSHVWGIVVDRVTDVVGFKAVDIHPSPTDHPTLDASTCMGLGCIKERSIMLLDIETIMTSEDMGLVDAHQNLVGGSPHTFET